MEDAHVKEPSEVCNYFQVDQSQGLTESQVIRHRSVYGKNELPQEEGTPFWKLCLKQFDDLLVKILIGAAIISFLLAIFGGEDGYSAFVEPLVILLILLANAAVGVITESNAEKAIEELKALQADVATVLRGGRLSIIPAAEVVCGDIVEVSVGCKIPADMRLIELMSTQLRVDQAILTGESGSVSKSNEATATLKAVYQEKTNILFSGTVVTAGRGRAVAIAVGSRTGIGKIRAAMSQSEEEMTPLKKKLDEFGTFLSKVIAVICILVWVVNIGHFRDPTHGGFLRGAIYYFKIAVALAVAAIPEGLPAVVTTCLALGTRKMAKLHAIVRTLPSVETLGCTTVICSDKTGTITTNMMSVAKVCVVRGTDYPLTQEFSVSGNTYFPEGEVTDESGSQVQIPSEMPCLRELAGCCVLCNDSSLQYNPQTKEAEKIGESTEAALRVLSEKIGIPGFGTMPVALTVLSEHERLLFCNHYWEQKFKKVASLEFSRDRKMMSVLCVDKEREVLFVKGAPEVILSRCSSVLCNDDGVSTSLTNEIREEIRDKFFSYGMQDALRCLAMAIRVLPSGQQTITSDDENDLTFLGLVGMRDPPREGVCSAIETCRSAGIRVIVVTGDNKATAESICRIVGVLDRYSHSEASSLTASEFDELPGHKKALAVKNLAVFSRVEPSHKSMLVEALKMQDEVVAMTGDGVNDAPALKKADIGIAMGSGTAVAKGASDMVLADNNFKTIVAAVAEGRAIYNNTKQFIRYMVSSNIGEVVCIFIAAALGMPETLNPVQLLWVNLVTDGLPATALGFNKQDKDVMRVRPRKVTEAIVDSWLFFRYLVIGVYVGIATIGGFGWWFLYSSSGPQMTWSQLVSFDKCVEGAQSYSCAVFHDRRPNTVAMSVLVTVEMFNALNNLSENQSLLRLPPWTNPWLLGAIVTSFVLHFFILYVPPAAAMFSVTGLSWEEWEAVIWLSFPVILVDEILKWMSRNMNYITGRSFIAKRWRRRRDVIPKLVREW